MNEKRMKAEYIKPESPVVSFAPGAGAVICASDYFFYDPEIMDREYEED